MLLLCPWSYRKGPIHHDLDIRRLDAVRTISGRSYQSQRGIIWHRWLLQQEAYCTVLLLCPWPMSEEDQDLMIET